MFGFQPEEAGVPLVYHSQTPSSWAAGPTWP